MVAYADKQGWKGGNYKKLNIVFENKLLGQPAEIRERMAKRVEEFVYHLLVDVFNAQDTAKLGIAAILEAGSYDIGSKATKLEDPGEWTEEKIIERARSLDTDKGPEGDFDD
jgi:fructose-bisphosphate aldolase class II